MNIATASASEVAAAIAAGKGLKLTLTCQITGKTRATGQSYMANKAKDFAQNYITKEVAQLLRAGKSVEFIREVFGTSDEVPLVTQEQALAFLAYNGKQKKA